MNTLFFQGSRDPAIEDVTNRWLIHPLSRAGLAWAIRHGISANLASIAGLVLGAGAAAAYLHWQNIIFAVIGLVLSSLWLVADGLDGMIARATGTASATGRVLDGLCDHGVFLCLYLALGYSIGFADIWLPMLAGACHAVQSSLYEAERARYHRRLRGDGGNPSAARLHRNPGVRLYETAFHALDRWADPLDRHLRENSAEPGFTARYRNAARKPLMAMTPLSANTRVLAIFLACVMGDPRLFWWFEIGPLTLLTIVTIAWHRRVETSLLRPQRPPEGHKQAEAKD